MHGVNWASNLRLFTMHCFNFSNRVNVRSSFLFNARVCATINTGTFYCPLTARDKMKLLEKAY